MAEPKRKRLKCPKCGSYRVIVYESYAFDCYGRPFCEDCKHTWMLFSEDPNVRNLIIRWHKPPKVKFPKGYKPKPQKLLTPEEVKAAGLTGFAALQIRRYPIFDRMKERCKTIVEESEEKK